MVWMTRWRKSSRFSYSSTKSICLPTVLSASENLAPKSWSIVAGFDASAQPISLATSSTDSLVGLTRT